MKLSMAAILLSWFFVVLNASGESGAIFKDYINQTACNTALAEFKAAFPARFTLSCQQTYILQQ